MMWCLFHDPWFDWGWKAVVRNLRILNIFVIFFIRSLIKFLPWSVSMALGDLNTQINLLRKLPLLFRSSGRGIPIQNFVSSSCSIRMYSVFLSVLDKNPTISMATLTNEASVITMDCVTSCFVTNLDIFPFTTYCIRMQQFSLLSHCCHQFMLRILMLK